MGQELHVERPDWHRVSVKSHLPESLHLLEKLSENLWWSWNFEARELFEEIAGPSLWKACEENPIHALQQLPLDRLENVAQNEEYINK